MDTIHVTDNALRNIRALQNSMDAQGYGLRFGFTSGGCSGNKYIIEFEDAPEAEDLIFKFDDVQVFVKSEQMPKLKNSVIDWKESLMEAGFDIDNPQAKRACGCGESVDLD
jgi:iron-sulfur cluster assembly accessory protein